MIALTCLDFANKLSPRTMNDLTEIYAIIPSLP